MHATIPTSVPPAKAPVALCGLAVAPDGRVLSTVTAYDREGRDKPQRSFLENLGRSVKALFGGEKEEEEEEAPPPPPKEEEEKEKKEEEAPPPPPPAPEPESPPKPATPKSPPPKLGVQSGGEGGNFFARSMKSLANLFTDDAAKQASAVDEEVAAQETREKRWSNARVEAIEDDYEADTPDNVWTRGRLSSTSL